MKIQRMKTSNTIRFFLTMCTSFYSLAIMAQASRTWVSGVGDDVNPCSRTAPCKTFAGAISKTAAGGEINAIDPGGFGAVTITKSMTIDGHGSGASILASSVNGIIINAPDGIVTLRHLSINGVGNGISGIKIINAKKVQIEDCYIANFLQKGIEITTPSACAVMINNVTIHNADDAVFIMNASGNTSIDGCRFQTVKNGINATGGTVAVTNSVLSDCRVAITAASASVVNLFHDVISYNEVALQGSGKINSAGNNFFTGNQTQGVVPTLAKTQ